MTREEALKKKSLDARWLINKIYDDFESRTCESCKWQKERNPFNKPIFPRHACSNADVIYMCKDKDFSCNKWESKD